MFIQNGTVLMNVTIVPGGTHWMTFASLLGCSRTFKQGAAELFTMNCTVWAVTTKLKAQSRMATKLARKNVCRLFDLISRHREAWRCNRCEATLRFSKGSLCC